tara:strand:+ start:29056 stop:30192 length:1137 start_codon:yes stop_codon:yes gene_type:complete
LKKILFIVSEDWYFVSHRFELAKEAISKGYEVSLLTNVYSHKKVIESAGINLLPWSLQRNSYNPIKEIKSILQIFYAINLIKPSLVHSVALKPILYSSIASKFTYIKSIVFAFAGLGYLFTSNKFLIKMARLPLLIALRVLMKNDHSNFIFQNQDDIDTFMDLKIANESNVYLIPGSGVNTNRFYPDSQKIEESVPIIILPARLLWDKGIGDFVEAAKILRNKDFTARFVLVGQPDPHNLANIPQSKIDEWVSSKIIEYWGFQEDMPKIFNQSTIVCLPSYREGFPKVLLEAASCSKPIIATDVPGCRQAVHHNKSGLLVPPRNPKALAETIEKMINDEELCKKMGEFGLKRVHSELSQEIISKKTFLVWEKIILHTY